MKTPKRTLLGGIAGAALATTSAIAAEEMRDVGQFSCKDVMALSGQERDLAIVFLHGYLVGKSGSTRYDTDALSEATDMFIDRCLDNPKDVAVKVLENLSK